MGRAPCCSKVGLRRGPWTLNEDNLLVHYIQTHGEGHWRSLPKKAGLLRCGKSCRLRWMNYLRPDIKRGNITPDEEDLIIRMHSLLGNRWSLIAGRLPGRTDNEIKNYWNSHLSKRSDSDKSRRYSADKAVKGPKRRKSDTTKVTKQTPKDPKNSRELTTKVKIHQPKAVRISASPSSMIRVNSNSSFNSRVGGDISVSSEGNKGLSRTLNRIREDVANEYIEDMLISLDCDILTSSNPCRDDNMDHLLLPDVPSNKEVLEKIFEEYQGVLMAEDHVQLESFLDSLWI